MSLRPGIGADAIEKIALNYESKTDFSPTHYQNEGDVPSVLHTDGKTYPIGRYLKRHFRKTLGLCDESLNTPEVKLALWKKEMSELYETHFKDAPFTPDDIQKKNLITQLNKATISQIESRFKFYNLTGAL